MTLNAGSSSIKFALFKGDGNAPEAQAIGVAETAGDQRRLKIEDGAGHETHEESWAGGGSFHADALRRILAWRQKTFPDVRVSGAGHRVVHGGTRYSAPTLVTEEVLEYLRTLIPLAPLHEPHNLAGIYAAQEAWPH